MATGKIYNIDAYNESKLWEFSYLKPYLARGIMPTDIDFMIESNGHFLVIEFKKPSVTIENLPKGQLMALQQLSRLPNFYVYIVWGEANIPERKSRVIGNTVTEPVKFDTSDFCEFVKKWQKYVDAHQNIPKSF